MIVATAGHVDHGKTLLIKALTGVDTDRLPEEKQRGMTIDLGFAYQRIDTHGSIGFVDVPGHERFIHNMLCGLTGIDFVLFVIAADDGPMPQTREHLAIIDLLEVSRGAVALTKIDRVSPDRLAAVVSDVQSLVAGTALAKAPLFPVSPVTGAGLDQLQKYIYQAAREGAPRPAAGYFRMPVDRCFTIAGSGLVVTGTVVAGSVATGGSVRALLAGVPVRVRRIHAQNAPSPVGRAGQRCALNLTGRNLERDRIARGDWIVAGEVPAAMRKLDARLRVLAGEPEPVAHWTPVHVHLGSADVTGRVAVLDGRIVPPGASALVQLVLDHPVGALSGDRFILRDQSAQRTIGGGRIIDIFPPRRGRAKPARLSELAALEDRDDDAALAALLDCARNGVSLARFAASRNLTAAEAAALFARRPMRTVRTAGGLVGYATHHWDHLKSRALEQLAGWHRRTPDDVGPAEDRVFAGSEISVPPEVAAAVMAELVAEGRAAKDGTSVRLITHRVTLNAIEAALWKRVVPCLEAGGLRPPTVRQIAEAVTEQPATLEALLIRAARHGLAVRISPSRFARPAALRRLGKIIDEAATASATGLVTAAQLRDRSGIGRDFSVEVLEFLDRIKLTCRIGDAHRPLRPIAEAFSDDPSGESSDAHDMEKNRTPVGRPAFKPGERR